MMIKITGKHILAGAALAVGGYILYKVYKKDQADREALEEHKEEVIGIGEQSIKDMMNDASFGNHTIDDVDARTKAGLVLSYAKHAFDNAKTIQEFDKKWDIFVGAVEYLTNPDVEPDAKVAWINFEHTKLEKKQKDTEAALDRANELEKYKTIARSVDGIARSLKNGNMPSTKDLEKVINITL